LQIKENNNVPLLIEGHNKSKARSNRQEMINQSKSVDPMPPKKLVITENEQRESEGDYENDEFENKDMV
jgi:hypothetical protein